MKKCLFFFFISMGTYAQITPSYHGAYLKKAASSSSDHWDSSTKSSCIVLSNGDLTSLESSCGQVWSSVYGLTAVSSGTKDWELTIDAWDNESDNNFDVMVGVTNSRTNQNTYFPMNGKGYGYILENGWKHKGSGSYPDGYGPYGDSYGIGDVIKISLNLSTFKITFYKNGVSQGEAFTVTDDTYYLAVSYVQTTNASITIN